MIEKLKWAVVFTAIPNIFIRMEQELNKILSVSKVVYENTRNH
jgi:hypothetical protein